MKKLLLFFTAVCLAVSCAQETKTEKPELRFREDGTFKIAQFTDLHWNEENQEAVEIIKNIVRRY